MARAGSCALVCVVCNNKVYSANAGDSLGLIITKNSNKMGYVEVNRELNANSAEERQRLKSLFPKEDDIVICKRDNNTACYVKGRLQPTRSLGDLRLKHSEFNNPESLTPDHDYQSQLKTFSGPYITWEPEIKTFELTENYKALVLASDGLWDEL